MTIIDPPSGWKYGFPKPIPEDRKKDVKAFLIEEGYPEEEIEKHGAYFFCRYWQEPDEESQVNDTKNLTKEKAIVKFNGGDLALLCNDCRTIIKTGVDFTEEEIDFAFKDGHLDPQYCDQCVIKDTKTKEKM